jgi:cell division septation protein DedD
MPNRIYDDEIDRNDGFEPRDREITLGATMILGIFLALVIVCAVFFGLGYQVGRRSVPGQVSVQEQALTNNGPLAEKPAAGSPLVGGSGGGGSSVTVPMGPAPAPEPQPTPVAIHDSETGGEKTGDGSGVSVVPVLPPPSSAPVTHPAPTMSPASAATPASPGWVVQVAAVSHQEDADLLAGELKRRGYNVAIHSEAGDKLLHVQIGPLATKKDADAMRQRLLNDGFNAIVKEIH